MPFVSSWEFLIRLNMRQDVILPAGLEHHAQSGGRTCQHLVSPRLKLRHPEFLSICLFFSMPSCDQVSCSDPSTQDFVSGLPHENTNVRERQGVEGERQETKRNLFVGVESPHAMPTKSIPNAYDLYARGLTRAIVLPCQESCKWFVYVR